MVRFCDQDCKEFQGELFGISNLFRDLSDKLFTSEIVELRKDSKKGVSDDEEEILCSSKQETQEPILGDLGKNKTDLCYSLLEYVL